MQAHHAKGIVDSQGILKIDAIPLLAGEAVDVIILPSAVNGYTTKGSEPTQNADPLAGIRVATGISDLAEKFDDYRFGKLSN